ncbi:MAG: UDP-glucose/GDP-mannose dehydrogenase family protein [Deltaproteobacteria bacterium]|nr:MAG: UDP-glucose/GDP-mannose dehydrogenase family protein [Deltaproteobacteria bacterium]
MSGKIGYAGMTHLGIVSALAATERGFAVLGYDPDAARIAALSAGALPVVEPDLPELFARRRDRIQFSADPDSLAGCDVVIVAADVPTDDGGGSDLSNIEQLLATCAARAHPEATLVVLSQVPPGFTRAHGSKSRPLHYQVETLIFGRAVERALQPERIIVGCEDPAQPLPSAYAELLASFGCPVLPMRYESAELAKISINLMLVASITAANTLAELCEAIGADWSEIAGALRLDRRIGAHAYLAPGLGLSGGNLERDLATIRRLAAETGCDARWVDAQAQNSQRRRDWALRVLHDEVLGRTADPRVAVLGLAYKADTASTKNSPALALIENLATASVRVFDPVVPASAAAHDWVVPCESALACCEGADAIVVMTPWRAFSALSPAELAARVRRRTAIDPLGALPAGPFADAGFDYFTLGAPPRRARPR